MRLKDSSVQMQGVRSEIIFALNVADKVYDTYGKEMVITSANDGNHSTTSLHYAGCAVDLRTNYFENDVAKEVTTEIKNRLNIDYDVIFEGNHIHLEFQPRRR